MTRRIADNLFTTLLMLTIAAALWMTHDWTYKVYFFPRVIGFFTLALLVFQLVMQVVRPPRGEESTPQLTGEAAALDRARFRSVALWFTGLVAMIVALGFPIGGTLSTLAYLRFAAKERWGVLLGVGLGVGAFFWVSSHPQLLAISYPEGWLISALRSLLPG